MRVRRATRLIVATSLLASGLVALAGAPATAASTTTVAVGDFYFEPEDLTVKTGDTVVWNWVGVEPHSVTAADDSFDSGLKYKGTFAKTFNAPTSTIYYCIFHGSPDGDGMAATITVVPALEDMPDAQDNVGTAINWSKSANPDGSASTVLLGREDVFADSLASGPVQGLLDAPLLLTPSGSLDARVDAELTRLGAKRIVILGGEVAISKAVEDSLRSKGYGVTRVGGAERIGTSLLVAQQYFGRTDSVIIARAFGPGTAGFADALSAGATGAKLGMPVVLNPTEALHDDVKAYLQRAGVKEVVIAGGQAAISKAVEDALKAMSITVTRLGGADRFETAALFRDFMFNFADNKALVVDGSGDNPNAWASGFAAAQSAGRGGLLIVIDRNILDLGPLYQFLIENMPAVVCGPKVPSAVCADIALPASVPSFDSGKGLLAWANDPSDPSVDGTNVLVRINPTSDATVVCIDWFGEATFDVVASHIHRQSDNVAVIDAGDATAEQIGGNGRYGCWKEKVAGAVADLFANPQNYYFNLHESATGPTVRGDRVYDPTNIWFVGLDASLEKHTGAKPDEAFGFGVAFPIADDPDAVCIGYFSMVMTFDAEDAPPTMHDVTAAHIHEGDENTNGPAVVTLPTPDAGETIAAGCTSPGAALVDEIDANPGGYYVNLHTDAHPQGAARGQLIDLLPDYSEQTGTTTTSSVRSVMGG